MTDYRTFTECGACGDPDPRPEFFTACGSEDAGHEGEHFHLECRRCSAMLPPEPRTELVEAMPVA